MDVVRKRAALVMAAILALGFGTIVDRHAIVQFIVTRAIGLATGYDVTIGDERLGASHGAFEHVHVAKGGEPVVDARRVDVWYSLRDLLPGSRHRFGLTAVSIDRPVITVVRHKDGTYNLAAAAAPAPPPTVPQPIDRVPFRFTVRIRHGSGQLRAPYALDAQARVLSLRDLTVDAAIDTAGRTHYTVNGAFREVANEPFAAIGTIDVDRGYAMHRAYAKSLPLRAIGNYFINSSAAQILAGTARNFDAKMYALDVQPFVPIAYHVGARLDVSDAGMQIIGLDRPLEHIAGSLQLVDDALFAPSLRATLAGIPVRVGGGIFQFASPQFRLGVSGTGELAKLRTALGFARTEPVSGSANLGVLVEGDLSSPLLAIAADAPQVIYRNVPLEDVRARAFLKDTLVALAPVEARSSGALLGLRGTLELGSPLRSRLALRVRAPADRLPYLGEIAGAEPLVADVLLAGTDRKFSAHGALVSERGADRLAALVNLSPSGVVDVSPAWVHAGAGRLDLGYHLDRSSDTSAFWIDAAGLNLHAPVHVPFLSSTLPQIPPIDGHIEQLRLTGGGPSGARALVAGSVLASGVTVAGVPIDRLDAGFAGTVAGAAIDRVDARGPWGRLVGSGSLSGQAIALQGAYDGTLEGLHPFLGGVPARGSVRGTVGLSIAPSGTTVQARNVRFAGASIRGIPIDSASGTFTVARGNLRVYSAHARVAGGDVVATGDYGGNAPMHIVASGLNGAALHGIGLTLDAGSVSASGTLRSGSPLPTFDGGASIAGGRVQHYAVAGSALVAIHDRRVAVAHGIGAIDGTVAAVSGDIGELDSGAPAYALHATVPAGDVSAVLHTLALPSLSSDGTFNGAFTVGGRGLFPTVSGPVNVPAGSINGLPFVDGHALLNADRTGVIARRGDVRFATTRVSFAAAERPRISGIHLRSSRANLEDFNNFFDTGDTLAGTGSLRVDAISQGHRISSNGTIDIDGLRYRNLPIGDTDATWASARNVLRGALKVGGAQGMLDAKGSIGFVPSPQWQAALRDARYDVNFSLSNLDISTWTSALGFPQVPVTGRLDGVASVHGRYPLLNLAGSSSLHQGTVLRLPIKSFELAFSSNHGRIRIDRSDLAAPGLEGRASGSFGLRPFDPLDLSVYAASDNVPLLVSQFSRMQVPVTGHFETTMHVGGTNHIPAFTAAFDADDVNAYGIHVASLFGSLGFAGRSVQLHNAAATFERGQVALAGTLPLQLQPFGVGPASAPVSFDLAVTNLDPSIFNTFLGSDTHLGGTVNGALGLAGTVRQPRIYGRFALANGSYASALERTPITHAQATLTFDRTQAAVQKLAARLGNGTLEGDGRITFANGFANETGGASYDVHARARGAQLDLPQLGRGTIDGTLALTRASGHEALLAADAVLSNATIPFSAFAGAAGAGSGNAGAGRAPALDFDANFTAGKNVRVRGSGFGAGLDIGAAGAVALRGSLAAPTLDGRFDSTGGVLTYVDRAFRVTQGSVVFDPRNGVLPALHARGATHVVNPDPDRARNPYGSVDVTISVDGPLDGLKIAFASDPPGYTQEQILALIAPFGGFFGGIGFNAPTSTQTLNGFTPLGALQPVPGTTATTQSGSINLNQEAFNILNAQFAAGLLSPLESAISKGLGFSDFNLTVDYYGNVGVTARHLLGKELSFVYGTTFGIPTRQSFGLEIAPNDATSATLAVFFENGPQRLFQVPTTTVSGNPRLSVGQPVQGQSGFSFVLNRSFW